MKAGLPSWKASQLPVTHHPPRSEDGFHKAVKLLIAVLAVFTVLHAFHAALAFLSFKISAESYRWYLHPPPSFNKCTKSRTDINEMAELTDSMVRVFDKLAIPAAVCYGTLWGVLRRQNFLPWDNNVDFCAMTVNLQNISFNDMEEASRKEEIQLTDYRYLKGALQFRKRNAIGYLNIFHDCSTFYYMYHSEYEHNPPSYKVPNQYKARERWACSFSVVNFVSRIHYDVNRPFPVWLLAPPFATQKLGRLDVNIPHDSVEMQKYIYPNDWWTEVKPFGCV